MNFFPSFQLFNYEFECEYKNIFLLLHRIWKQMLLEKRDILNKYYKTFKSLNKND